VDLDVFVTRHRPEWQRLEQLTNRAGRPSRLSGAELDELVDLYQRAATHLSAIRTRSPDPALLDSLSGLVTSARQVLSGARSPGWRQVIRFFGVTFPVAVWERRWWLLWTSLACCAVSLALGVWVATDRHVAGALLQPEQVQRLCGSEFSDYYRSAPAGSFAGQVWTNNLWVAATAVAFGVLLGIPTVFVLGYNAVNVGISGGYLASCGRTAEFFTLILPHGLLELTAVFLAGATGLRLGWRVVAPGPRRRIDAVAAEGRAAFAVALGLVVVLAISGLLEAFVTPSPLPAAVRLATGAVVWAAVLGYLLLRGRAALGAAGTGDGSGTGGPDLADLADLADDEQVDALPVSV